MTESTSPPAPASELPTWARDEAYRLVCENSWGWTEESASDELTPDQERHVEWLAGELAKIVAARLPLHDASELPSGPGIELPNHWGHWRKDGWGEIWVKDDGHWAVMEYDHRVLGTYHSRDDLPRGGWHFLADAAEVERPTEEFACIARPKSDPPQDCDFPFCGCSRVASEAVESIIECGWLNAGEASELRQQLLAAQSALAAERELARLKEINAALHDDDIVGMHARALTAERERDEWKRQHDRVLSQAQKDFDRAAMADTYEQWLLDLGRISGCGHVDERLPRCIEEAFAKEQERATAAEQRLADYEEVYKEVLASNRRLAKRLDQLLNGDKAAEQASLCDLVAQVSTLTGEIPLLERLAEVVGALERLGKAVIAGGPPDDIGPSADIELEYYQASDAVKAMAVEIARAVIAKEKSDASQA